MSLEEILSADDSAGAFLEAMQELEPAEAKTYWNAFLVRASDDEQLRELKNSLAESGEFSSFLVELFVSETEASE